MSSWPDPRPALSLFPIWAQCSAPCEVVSQKLWLFLFSWCLPINLQTDFSGSYFMFTFLHGCLFHFESPHFGCKSVGVSWTRWKTHFPFFFCVSRQRVKKHNRENILGGDAEHGVSVTVCSHVLSGHIKMKRWLRILETSLPSHIYMSS